MRKIVVGKLSSMLGQLWEVSNVGKSVALSDFCNTFVGSLGKGKKGKKRVGCYSMTLGNQFDCNSSGAIPFDPKKTRKKEKRKEK